MNQGGSFGLELQAAADLAAPPDLLLWHPHISTLHASEWATDESFRCDHSREFTQVGISRDGLRIKHDILWYGLGMPPSLGIYPSGVEHIKSI